MTRKRRKLTQEAVKKANLQPTVAWHRENVAVVKSRTDVMNGWKRMVAGGAPWRGPSSPVVRDTEDENGTSLAYYSDNQDAGILPNNLTRAIVSPIV
ncbi:hypothetical protein VTN00DRAFT_5517 [Thermoascus crustaceus]|uniref:uncharacterized protein n=1 Tax=Thermoascus crustaceus TaxID=5088 RepID=UPI00374488A0